MKLRRHRRAAVAAAMAPLVVGSLGISIAGSARASGTFIGRVWASGAALTHPTPHGSEMVTGPDDLTVLGRHIFVGFQNGVGPQGGASSTGNRRSTIVEFDLRGRAVDQWDVTGKCDGLTVDPATGRVIATVNEDAHSALYLIDPVAGVSPVRYRYSEALPSRGGTDAISVYRGMILISASAPGTTGAAAPRATYPAVYRAVLDARTRVATVKSLFGDEARATVADGPSRGRTTRLALTDPDSNEVVPAFAPRFGGDFMLTSQGDKVQIFVHGAATGHQTLSVLKLSDAVDDTAWASDATGAIYTTDNGADTVDKITGAFHRGDVLVADTPCDAVGAPAACPGPGYPDNFLGDLDARTGKITAVPVDGPAAAQGMVFVP